MTTKHKANIHADWLESFENDEADFSKEDMQECVKLLRTIPAGEAKIEALQIKIVDWENEYSRIVSQNETNKALLDDARSLQEQWPDSEVSPQELAALLRFKETLEDGEGYDVPEEMMQRLGLIGLICRTSRGLYTITFFGDWVMMRAAAKAQPKGAKSK